jgi:hypothetical protein
MVDSAGCGPPLEPEMTKSARVVDGLLGDIGDADDVVESVAAGKDGRRIASAAGAHAPFGWNRPVPNKRLGEPSFG